MANRRKCYTNRLKQFLPFLLGLLAFFQLSALANNHKVAGEDNAIFTSRLLTQVSNVHPVVGEQVVLRFELLVNGFFNGGTQFELPSMSTARLSRASSFAINGNKKIAGVTYSSQLWEVYLYPEQQGLIELPSVRFDIKFMDNVSLQPKTLSLLSEPKVFYAYTPADIPNNEPYIVAEQVSIDEQWSEPKQSYQIGDVIEREITISVVNLPSMNIPRLKVAAPKGVKLIAQEAKLKDKVNRGESIATVSQTYRYIIHRSGEYLLGGENLNWWQPDVGLNQLQYSTYSVAVKGSVVNHKWLLAACVLVLAIVGLMLICKYKKLKLPQNVQLSQALMLRDWRRFINLLYQRGDKVSAPAQIKPHVTVKQPVTDELTNKQQAISRLFEHYFGPRLAKERDDIEAQPADELSLKKLFRYVVR
ncbi:BatD family protein [Shewanella kaireitica]|uniref:BatD family protein n=1 Tax=Shewanella kaireitica TaxID=212021 RepID=UPI00200D63FD|nr:BatD family protein [Shewanella kaireitica]MCL1093613.1 BatD family protein [Shewanella kaireitica]